MADQTIQEKPKRTVRRTTTKKVEQAEIVSETLKKPNTKKLVISLITFLILLGLALALTRYKGLFLAATIDNKPIFRWELNDKLTQRYGEQVVDEMVTHKLVKDELTRLKVVITDSELQAEIAEIEQGLGGQKFDEVIKQQNLNYTEVIEQIKLQMGVEKVLKDKVTVSEEEVTAFVTANGSLLPGTTDEEKKVQARQNLESQKLQEAIGNWVTELKNKAKVTTYL